MGGSSLAPDFANIVSTGSYLPEIEVTNDMLRVKFDAAAPEFVNKMEASSGIRSRWYAPAARTSSDRALRAAQHAHDRTGKEPGEVDRIIPGTNSPHYTLPPTS